MGNICRSPTAEGVFRHHAAQAGVGDRIRIDSAGTHAYHVLYADLPEDYLVLFGGFGSYQTKACCDE